MTRPFRTPIVLPDGYEIAGEGDLGTGGGGNSLLHVREEQSPGTDGDGLTPGSWVTRTLNTVVTNEISGASLATSQLTLPAGTYEANIRVPAYRTNEHTARLRDVTNGLTLLSGSAERTHANAITMTNSWVSGRFTLAAETVVEVQHIVREENSVGIGGGTGFDFGQEVVIFTEAWIERIAGGGGVAFTGIESDLVIPPASGWSWVNQGSATVTALDDDRRVLASPAAGATNAIVEVRAHSSPSTVTVRVDCVGWGAASQAGIYLRESSTGKMVAFAPRPRQRDLMFENWNSPTSLSGTVLSTTEIIGIHWLQVEDDGTDLTFRVSETGLPGTWIDHHTVSRTAFLAGGPDEIGWGVRDGNGQIVATLHSWSVT